MSEELGNNNADQSASEPTLPRLVNYVSPEVARKNELFWASTARAEEEYMRLDWESGEVGAVSISANGKIGASAVECTVDDNNEVIKVWDTTIGKCMRDLKGTVGCVTSMAMSANGERIVAGSFNDCSIRVWDVSTGDCVCVVDLADFGPYTVAEGAGSEAYPYPVSVSISADGRVFMGAQTILDKSHVWEIDNGKYTRILEDISLDGDVVSVSLSATGERAMVCTTASARVLSVPAGECLFSFWMDEEETLLKCGTISPNGEFIVVGDSANEIRVVGVSRSFLCLVLLDHTSPIRSVAVSFDNKRIVSAGRADDIVRIWDVETGKCNRLSNSHIDGIDRVAISGDGGVVMIGTCGDVRLYPSSKEYRAEVGVWRARRELDTLHFRDTTAALADRDPKKIKLEDE
jgi:WD40 repeat protein